MKKFKKVRSTDGSEVREELDLKKLLNLKYLDLTNRTHYVGCFDLPSVYCSTDVFPDYIALYGDPKDYKKTALTAVGFFEFDHSFDGQHGLCNAIYYNNEADLAKFKERFSGVKFFIGPDCSLLGDIDQIENIYRIKRSRLATLWFCKELKAVSIPLLTFPTLDTLDCYLDGLEDCEVIAISTKGHIADPTEYKILCLTIEEIVKKLHLKAIVVYDVCGDETKTLKAFEPATKAGIKVIIPDNSLKQRNKRHMEERHEKR